MSTKSVLKTILLVWGIVSLCIVIILGVLLGIMLLKQKQWSNTTYEPLYTEKSFGEYTLKTTINDTANPDIIHITLLQQRNVLLNNYRLPIEKYGLSYGVRIDSVVVVKEGEDVRGIIIISNYSECACENNDQYLWFLSLKDTEIKIVEVFGLSDLRVSSANKNVIWGNKNFFLETTHFSIPIEITIGKSIHIKPLLSQNGISFAKEAFEKDLNYIYDEVKASKDTTTLKEYKEKSDLFQNIIQEKTVSF